MIPLENNVHCCESTCSFFWWCAFFYQTKVLDTRRNRRQTDNLNKNVLSLFKGNINNWNHHPFWENHSVSFFSSQVHQGSSWLLAVCRIALYLLHLSHLVHFCCMFWFNLLRAVWEELVYNVHLHLNTTNLNCLMFRINSGVKQWKSCRCISFVFSMFRIFHLNPKVWEFDIPL